MCAEPAGEQVPCATAITLGVRHLAAWNMPDYLVRPHKPATRGHNCWPSCYQQLNSKNLYNHFIRFYYNIQRVQHSIFKYNYSFFVIFHDIHLVIQSLTDQERGYFSSLWPDGVSINVASLLNQRCSQQINVKHSTRLTIFINLMFLYIHTYLSCQLKSYRSVSRY